MVDLVRPEFTTIVQGETRSIAFRIVNNDGTPYNLTNFSEIRCRFKRADGQVMEKTVNGVDHQVSTVDLVSGRAMVALTAGDTALLRPSERQDFSVLVEFGGSQTAASVVYGGVTYTAAVPGTGGNAISLVFDGIKTIAMVVNAWNAAHPTNMVGFTGGLGTDVPSAGTATLVNGTTTPPTTVRIINFPGALSIVKEAV